MKETKTLTDIELIAFYKENGNKDFVGELYKRYTKFVITVCMKYLNSIADSEDAAMQIFEKLFSDLLKHEIKNFKSWLHVSSKNYCLMKLRKPEREIFTEKFVEYENYLHPNDSSEKEEKLTALEQALEQLTQEQKTCIELFYLHEKSYNQIVEITGFDFNKVKSYIQNGKRNLQLKLKVVLATILVMLFIN